MDDWGWDQLRPWVEHRAQLPVGQLLCIVNGQHDSCTPRADYARERGAAFPVPGGAVVLRTCQFHRDP
jgi:hypothetical protein